MPKEQTKDDKSLKDKAIKIQGKDYVLVSDRVIYFNEKYTNGCIQTKQLPTDEPTRVEFQAIIIPDVEKPTRFFTGHSQAVWGTGMVNKTSALENAETSAVGRALALMGIGVIDSIASVDEINKAKGTEQLQELVIVGKCNICGTQGVKSFKSGRYYCPNWQKHQAKGEKWELVQDPKILDVHEQNFIETLDSTDIN
jgi:hypothetical protein